MLDDFGFVDFVWVAVGVLEEGFESIGVFGVKFKDGYFFGEQVFELEDETDDDSYPDKAPDEDIIDSGRNHIDIRKSIVVHRFKHIDPHNPKIKRIINLKLRFSL